MDQVDEYVERNAKGYRSRAEVVAAAVREFLARENAPNLTAAEIETAVGRYLQQREATKPASEPAPPPKSHLRRR